MMHEGMPGMGPHPPGYEPEAGWMTGVIGEQPWQHAVVTRVRAKPRWVWEAGRHNPQPMEAWAFHLGIEAEVHRRYGERDDELRWIIGRFLQVTVHLGWWFVYFGPMWACAVEE